MTKRKGRGRWLMCKCVKILSMNLSEHLGVEGRIINQEMLSGRLYSTFQYQDGKRVKKQLVLHNYCPICGKKYEEEKS